MGEKCCGCCSLSTATVVAALIGAIECTIGLFWNAELWMHLERKSSLGIFPHFVTTDDLKDYNIVHGLIYASTVLHCVWLILSAMLLRANVALYKGVMTTWMLFVDLQTCFDVGTTIYFTVRVQSTAPLHEMFVFYNSKNEPTVSLTYVTLLVLFSRGVIFWFLNLYLAHVVQLRGKEIQYNNSLMALYLLSHLSPPRTDQNPETQRLLRPRRPPAYCNPCYLPKFIVPGCRDSLDSSWSLNNEIQEGINSYTNPLYPRIDQTSISELRVAAMPTQQPPPYGEVVDIEQSYIHEGRDVLRY